MQVLARFGHINGALLTCIGLMLTSLPRTAQSHPHVWVSVKATVQYEGGRIVGLRQKWSFDDMYTAMAIQGLDANRDGTYTREELQELAQVNIDGLKEFGYFTYAKLGKTDVSLGQPADYWLDHTNGVLSLNFTMPLAEPVLANADGFQFSVYDETFYIAFDIANKEAIALSAGAPDGCSAVVGVPDKELAQLQALNDAFGGALTTGDQNMGLGAGYSKTVTIGCGKT